MDVQQIKKGIGNRIKEERETWDWTQEGLAEKLQEAVDGVNVTGTAISNYERGATMPSVQVLYALADVFHVTTDYLMGRSKSKNPEAADVVVFTGLTEEAAGVLHNMHEADQALDGLGTYLANKRSREKALHVNECDIVSEIIMHGRECFKEAAALQRYAARMPEEYRPFMAVEKRPSDVKLQRGALTQVEKWYGPCTIVHGKSLLLYKMRSVVDQFERLVFRICGLGPAIAACEQADKAQRNKERLIIQEWAQEGRYVPYPKDGICPKCNQAVVENAVCCAKCGAKFIKDLKYGGKSNGKE